MADTTKLIELLGEQEALRIEHNAQGKEYREGRLSLIKWIDFKAAWMAKSQDCCARLCAEKDAQGISTGHKADGCDIFAKADADAAEATGKDAVPLVSKTKAELVAAYAAAQLAAKTEKTK